MAHQIIWSRLAARDLEGIVAYISRDSFIYAANAAQKILDSIERLRVFPRIGRIVPEFDDESIRELIVYSYRVIYRVRKGDVVVAAIIHGARDLPNALRGARSS